ncbi:hypothetical protein SPRG_00251 [Saprolegnia parasitica CBS 223.65]|uniref:N-acetyltransferase domain-containing protein n=1 Tax=Saprolegnia parasitica (strain CBS 223.65) TaxID=695850 RepID=A0A067D9R6_SAPPC|nr:hypothetical protein SPRG_00251 [Saprolegnia parasitica CBS 223.65]KDO35401.1 hypothetical protein SPRG_00251 [Saprolegnia parasitica CBS 223.65]|eukprot:XP_012193744.1 hypothetical protein SPRG_00251 [Saprolegnia parasitica CBS 223.65]
MTAINWVCKPFAKLSATTLYDILHVRCAVFVVEQRCAYLDADNVDKAPTCLHLIGTAEDDHTVAAYARLLGPGTKSPTQVHAVISRVVTAPAHRGSGVGKALMTKAIEACDHSWPNTPILLNAQARLAPFYSSLGFVQSSELYTEDGIEAIDMLRHPPTTSA